MPTLHLGVIDVPYVEAGKKRGSRRPHKAHAKKYDNKTTGDVAEILEAKYHVMEHFSVLHETEITDFVRDGLEGAVESIIAGAPASIDPFGGSTSKIEDAFKTMLSSMELDALGYPGIPTQAALGGISHRFKNARRGKGGRARPPRPSFIDTGLYQASFKAWVD